MKHLTALLPLLLLSACDPFGLPEEAAENATYYVATSNHAGFTYSADSVAIAYETPDGLAHDTIVGDLTSWSKVFERDALSSFSLTATNLTVPDDSGDVGYISASLLVDQETVAFDSSKTEVSLSN